MANILAGLHWLWRRLYLLFHTIILLTRDPTKEQTNFNPSHVICRICNNDPCISSCLPSPLFLPLLLLLFLASSPAIIQSCESFFRYCKLPWIRLPPLSLHIRRECNNTNDKPRPNLFPSAWSPAYLNPAAGQYSLFCVSDMLMLRFSRAASCCSISCLPPVT